MQFTKPKMLFVSAALIISGFLIAATYKYKKWNQMRQPHLSGWSLQRNHERSDIYSDLPIDSGDIVFIGDSHIERFLLTEYFPCKHIRNRGIGSNTTFQVLERLYPILERKPSKVFVLAGINDLAFNYTVDSTANIITQIIRAIKGAKAKPYIISIPPAAGDDLRLNPSIMKLNRLLQMYCASMDVTYIDLYRLVNVHNRLNPALTIDSCHFNSAGYKLFKGELDKFIN